MTAKHHGAAFIGRITNATLLSPTVLFNTNVDATQSASGGISINNAARVDIDDAFLAYNVGARGGALLLQNGTASAEPH